MASLGDPTTTLRSPAPNLTFGPFEFRTASAELRKHGYRVRLPAQTGRVLGALVERPGELVTRDDLRSLLWPGATAGDFEHGINSAVNRLRQALGDSADHPRYVETLSGRGYRFIAPVDHPPARAVLKIAAPAALRIEPKPRLHPPWVLLLVAGVAVAMAAGSGYWFASRSAATIEAPKLTRWTVLPPSGFALEGAASRQSFALSPDGSRLAFTAMDSSGAFSVFLRDFDSLETRLVPGSNGAHTVFWPPDGRSLYLTVMGKLWRTPLDGNARVFLADAPSFLLSGAWLGPERILLDAFRESDVVSPSGGPPERLNDILAWPQILPDREHVLYVVWDAQAGRHRARVRRFDDASTTKDLVETDSRVLYTASTATPGTGYLLYVRAGSLLAHPFDPRSLRLTGEAMPVTSSIYSFAKTGAADFSVSDQGAIAYQTCVGRSQLVWVDRAGHQLAPIGPANINVKSGRLSPDGKRLATAIYDVEQGEQDLWIFDLDTNLRRRLTADPAIRDAPVWSPDSRTLAFLYQADGSPPHVRVRGSEAEDADETMPAGDFQMPADWSPDGRFIAYVNTGFPRVANDTQGDVWVFDLARDRKPVPLLNTRFHEANPAFSPDGKWLAFTSNESGRPEVYIQAFQAAESPGVVGERYRVSRDGAQALRWRRDGKELFYLGFDGTVQAVAVKLSPRPEFGPATPLFTISTEARAAIHSVIGFDVSADGQRFVIPVVAPGESPSIVVVQNWEALLPHKP